MTPKTLFVTGGGSGLGLEIVRAAAARGHKVICTGRRAETDLPAGFPDIPYLRCDLATPDGPEDAARWALNHSAGRIGCAILNAGSGYFRPLEEESAETIGNVVALNLEANVVLAHKLHSALEGGTLALIGSVARKGAPGMPIYSASKGALDGFGRALAEEWRGRTTVRVLHPGPTATGMSVRAGRRADLADRLFLSPRLMARAVLDAALAPRGRDRQVIGHLRALRTYLAPTRPWAA